MQVEVKKKISNVRSLERGVATWGEDRSIRNRYDNGGRFSRSGSSEIPVRDLAEIVAFGVEELTTRELHLIIGACHSELANRCKE